MTDSLRNLILLASLTAAGGMAAQPEITPAAEGTPVVAELFTSEGCSSCPPADRLLAEFDRHQPVAGAHLIVLSEHVDYWNDGGWADPYSSAAFTERQREYANRLPDQGVYTPELVIDGQISFVGSNRARAEHEIAAAARAKKVAVRLTGVSRQDDRVTLTVELPSGSPSSSSVQVAIAEDTAASNVSRGENAGRHLAHVAVVRSITAVGSAKGNAPATYSKTLKIPRGASGLRLVAFVQDSKSWRILGAAEAHL